MLVLELMKTHVVTVSCDAPLGEAVDLMDLYQTVGLPVVSQQGALCGFVTESDIFRAITTSRTDAHPFPILGTAADLKISDVMTPDVRFVTDTDDLLPAALMLLESGFRTLPVVTKEGKVIGTLARVDLLQAFFEGLL